MDYENILKEQFNNVIEDEDFAGISEDISGITEGISDYYTIENILNATLSGESIINSKELIENFKDLLLYEIQGAMVLGVEILSICIITGLLKSLSSSFNSKGVSDISFLVCTMVIIGISINSFRISYQLALDTVSTMVSTMAILMPVLIGILISTGAVASGTILSPIIIGSITGFGYLIKTFVMPALFISTILSLINSLTEKDYVNKLSKLIRGAAVFITGLILTILTGIITLQGLLTETSDGLLINAAKYSLSTFIPIVGGFTSDTVELFLRCMGSIKSIVGIFAIAALVLLTLVPLLKIFIVAVIYKLIGALAEPISDSKIADGLNDMGTCLISIGSVMFFTSLLFVMFVSIVIRIGGA